MSSTLQAPILVTNGAGVFNATDRPQIAAASGIGLAYMVAGGPIKVLNCKTNSMVSFVTTAGVAPSTAKLAAFYRGRLILAGVDGDEANFFASRVDAVGDWAYGKDDSATAFAGNTFPAGRASDIITALIPIADKFLVLGGDHTVATMVGDIAYGGSLEQSSDQVGIFGPEAWCLAPDNTLYFVGTAGLYRMAPGGQPVNVANQRYSKFFEKLDRVNYWIQLRWDERNHGLWIFCTPRDPSSAVHLWFDARNNAFWPMAFSAVQHGPTASIVYDGDLSDDSGLFLGGRDNFLRKLDATAIDDDGVPVQSSITLGPYRPAGDVMEAKLVELAMTLGELPAGVTVDQWGVDWALHVDEDPYSAIVATPVRTGSWTTPARQDPIGLRCAGNTFLLKLSNTTPGRTWAMDRAVGRLSAAGGKQR
jgi:hypothetical protein